MTTTPTELHGVLVVDKSRGPTSHDVVSNARRALRTRAIGHSGTLDPMATGVLVLAIGEGTKLVNYLMASRKVYETTVLLGRTTSSLDADGDVVAEAPVPELSREQVEACARAFVGEIDQRVPDVSAIKVDGVPLYQRARKGQEVDAPTRRVSLHSLEILAVREREIDLRLSCSKGFYVRSLARDLAEALGTVGHLSALRRLQNGAFSVTQAVDQVQLRAAAQGDEELRARMRAAVLPLHQVARGLSHVVLSETGAQHAFHGRLVPVSEVRSEVSTDDGGGVVKVAFDEQGSVLGLVERVESGDSWRVVRGIRCA
ncbi:MAG: tRNA pseudouridine(55) synthase TruB [Myxococcales bacterium]